MSGRSHGPGRRSRLATRVTRAQRGQVTGVAPTRKPPQGPGRSAGTIMALQWAQRATKLGIRIPAAGPQGSLAP